MPWICKVKSPFGEKGKALESDGMWLDFGPTYPKKYFQYSRFLDLFEFVEEKKERNRINLSDGAFMSDIVEISGKKFKLHPVEEKSDEELIISSYPKNITAISLVEKLLYQNAIKPEFLEKLRRGE